LDVGKRILVLFALILCGSYILADQWFGFQHGKSGQPAGAAVRMLADDGHQISFQIDIEGLQVGVQPSHGALFSTLDVPGAGWTNEVGGPRLPVLRRFVEIPVGATATATIEALDVQTFPLAATGAEFELFPVQLPVEKIPGVTKPFQKDARIYAADALYPAANLTLAGPLGIRDRNLVLAEFAPVRYNPVRREIEVIRSAVVHLTLRGGDAAKSDALAWDKYSPSFERWFEANVTNYRPFDLPKGTSTLKYAEGILYIVGHAYINNAKLIAYVAQRQADGNKVVMVDASTIGTTDTAIRTYVQGQFASWTSPALSYVVLVGDVADVPTHSGVGGSGGGQATDLYYSAITPDPYTSDWSAPDLIVSRISCDSTAELELYIDRAVKYTTANFTNTAWMNKLSFPASSDNYSITEGTHNYVINNHTSALGYTGTFPTNPAAGGDKCYVHTYSLTATQEAAAFNDGRLVINDSGHGDQTYWADPSFTAADLANVTHADAMPFVISNACLTGSYARTGGDCWGEIWLAHSSGSILFWGASNSSYWDEDDILEKRMWDGIFNSGITTLGDIILNAKLQTLANFGANATMYYYFEMYNMLGDATIDLYTDVYYNIHASYPAEIMLGQGSVTFNVTDAKGAVADALVSLRGINVQQVGYTDASGNVTLVMNPMPDTVGTLNVTITAHNGKRLTGTIGVIPASGPYLSYTSHEVTSDGSTPTTPNPGKHIVLPVTLHNVGVATAQSIAATLTSVSPNVTITDDSATYGDIAVGADGRSLTHFEIDIHSDAPDLAAIPFVIQWSASGANGTTNFSLTVERPILGYVSHTVDDSAGGCDTDGIADANEATDFTVTIENTGSGDATGVAVDLSAPGCTVTGPMDFGSIASGASATRTFTVTPGAGVACPAEDVVFTVSAGCNQLTTVDETTFTELLNADIIGGQFLDAMETGVNGWTHSAAQGSDDWNQVTTAAHSPTHSWWASEPASVKDDYLFTPNLMVGGSSTMSFWHKRDLENGYDGAVIEITTDGGSTWTDLGAYITQNPYNSTISTSFNSPIAGRAAWSGLADWQESVVNLSSFGPNTIKIRFRLASDSSVSKNGWWIDDLMVDSQTVACQQTPCEGPVHMYGDLDSDDDCDSADCALLCQYLCGEIPGFGCGETYADLDVNMLVNGNDLVILLNHLVGNIPTIPLP
jgi:hypothetical protein